MAVPRWGGLVVGLALALAPVVALGLTGSSVTQPSLAAPSTRLDSCTTISESGHYVLSRDIGASAETCLRVEADDVVVSGAGHAVDGGAFRENTTGVAVTGTNVTVRNLTVRRWTFGIRYEGAPGGTIRNVTSWRTVDGVTVVSSPRANVEEVSAANGATGVSLVDSDASTVHDSVVRYQSSTGVFVADSRRVAVTNATVARTDVGIALLGSRHGRVNDSFVRVTGRSALLLVDSRANSVGNVTLQNPGREATVLLSNATDNRLVGMDGNWTLRSVDGARGNDVVNTSSESTDYPLSA